MAQLQMIKMPIHQWCSTFSQITYLHCLLDLRFFIQIKLNHFSYLRSSQKTNDNQQTKHFNSKQPEKHLNFMSCFWQCVLFLRKFNSRTNNLFQAFAVKSTMLEKKSLHRSVEKGSSLYILRQWHSRNY